MPHKLILSHKSKRIHVRASTQTISFSHNISLFVSQSSFLFQPDKNNNNKKKLHLAIFLPLLYSQVIFLGNITPPNPLQCVFISFFHCQSSRHWGVLRWSIFILSVLSHYRVKPKDTHTHTRAYNCNEWMTNAKICIHSQRGKFAFRDANTSTQTRKQTQRDTFHCFLIVPFYNEICYSNVGSTWLGSQQRRLL